MRFRHQVHQVKVPAPDGKLSSNDLEEIVQRFVRLYEQNFGQGTAVTEAGVEILTFHVVATTHYAPLELRESAIQGHDPNQALAGTRPVFFDNGFVETPIFEHSRLVPGNKVSGPAIIEGANTTLALHPGQEITVDGFRNLLLHFAEEST
jgi:N-methylhydantoinase A